MRISQLRAVLLCLTFCSQSLAHQTSRFQSFFRNSQKDFLAISTQTCNASLIAFENAYANSSSPLAIDLGIHSTRDEQYVEALCRDHASCMLNNTPQFTQSAIATASIILGLLPTLLAVLSPSIAEVALLSAQRPLLATLTSLGSPGVLQTRVFEYTDPGAMLDLPEDLRRDGKRLRLQLVLGPWKKGWLSSLVAILEYVLVLASAANTQWLAVQLSQKSILSWGCTRAIWPTVLWSIFPIFMDGLGALGYRLTLENGNAESPQPGNVSNALTAGKPSRSYSFFTKPESDKDFRGPVVTSSEFHSGPSDTTRSSSLTNQTSLWKRFLNSIVRELMPCACHPKAFRAHLNYRSLPSKRVTLGVVLHCIAGFLSFFHLVYGTVTFSALLFIDTLDAVGEIAMRFLVSSLICRFVVLIEIAGMRGNMLSSR